MLNAKFLEGLSGGVADRWLANLFTPAFVFWVGGAVAIFQDAANRKKFQELVAPLTDTQEVGLLVFALLLVALSSFVMQRFDFLGLRWLEGYWPWWLRPARRPLVVWQRWQKQRTGDRWQQLYSKKETHGLTLWETEDLAQIEVRLRYLPEQDHSLMPTPLGNILRAAEEAPYLRYGLDPVLCWPHLWLILPEQTRNDVSAARNDLNTAVRVVLWGVLFAVVWTYWALWALGGLVVAWIAYRWALNAATIYADLLTATIAIHRFELYQALKWPRPNNPTEEKQLAAQLNTYLARGYTIAELQYCFPDE